MSDPFSDHTPGLQSPAMYLSDISPSDTDDLPRATRALNVATSGFVRVTTVNGDEATVYIAAGITFPIRVQRVWATGTDASGIVGMG
jgi:hypothetical protein